MDGTCATPRTTRALTRGISKISRADGHQPTAAWSSPDASIRAKVALETSNALQGAVRPTATRGKYRPGRPPPVQHGASPLAGPRNAFAAASPNARRSRSPRRTKFQNIVFDHPSCRPTLRRELQMGWKAECKERVGSRGTPRSKFLLQEPPIRPDRAVQAAQMWDSGRTSAARSRARLGKNLFAVPVRALPRGSPATARFRIRFRQPPFANATAAAAPCGGSAAGPDDLEAASGSELGCGVPGPFPGPPVLGPRGGAGVPLFPRPRKPGEASRNQTVAQLRGFCANPSRREGPAEAWRGLLDTDDGGRQPHPPRPRSIRRRDGGPSAARRGAQRVPALRAGGRTRSREAGRGWPPVRDRHRFVGRFGRLPF